MIEQLNEEVEMLERHLEILQLVIEDEPIGIVNLSKETGHPHHKVRYSLRVLEEQDLIEATSQGAMTTEQTEEYVADSEGRLDEIIEKLENIRAVQEVSA